MSASMLLRITIVTVALYTVSSAPYDLEADLYEETLRISEDRLRDRSNANNGRNVWLKKGESLTMKFCLGVESYVSIKNICWSNDGWLDTVIVKVNDEVVGNFSTNDNSDWGFLWNKMYESGPIGDELDLTSGEHTLTLEVPMADQYGVEIDKVVLEVDGEMKEGKLACVKVADDKSAEDKDDDNGSYNPY